MTREIVQDTLRLFDSCASTLVSADYAHGYREACQHVLDKLPESEEPRKPATIADFKAQIEAHKNAIAAHRDALRDLLDDLHAEVDSFDTAIEELESACDTLSQYV